MRAARCLAQLGPPLLLGAQARIASVLLSAAQQPRQRPPAAAPARADPSLPPLWQQPHRGFSRSSQAAQHEQQQQAPPGGEQPCTQHCPSEAAESFINVSAAAASSSASAGAAAAAAAAASAGGVLAGAAAAPTAEYSLRQVAKHSTDESCWIVVNGKVYDVTSYIDDHPGGADSILQNAGVDCTEEFMGVHTQEAKQLLERFVIGRVKPGTKAQPRPASVSSEEAAAAAAVRADPSKPPVLLADPQARYALPLAEKRQLNHDTFFMRFALPTPQHQLGLPCGKHVFLAAEIGGEPVVRAYTPISGDRDLGVLDFLIKVYWAGQHPAFPGGGKMTQHLAAMREGDSIDVKGPYGKFHYLGRGQYTLNRAPGTAAYLSMVAGGSGVTPCYSVLREVLQDPADATRCSLVYANKHDADIWLRPELDELARRHPDRFHLWYVVEQPGAQPGAAAWPFSRGYVTPDMLAQHLLPPRPASLVGSSEGGPGALALMCGPPPMLEKIVVPSLASLGFAAEQLVVF